MVPLQVYRTSGASLLKRGWIDPEALSPWNVMSWGMKQLKGIIVGSDNIDSASPLRGQELVLVENLRVSEVLAEQYWTASDLETGSGKSSGKTSHGSDFIEDGPRKFQRGVHERIRRSTGYRRRFVRNGF